MSYLPLKIVISDVSWLWEGCIQEECDYSLINYVENHGKRLRSKYLKFIFDLGETVVDDRSIVEYFEISSGFSLWWMTLLAEKSLYKSTDIVSCLKLLAIEEILKQKQPKNIEIIGDRNNVEVVAIMELCQNVGVGVAINDIGLSSFSIHSKIIRLMYMFNHLLRGIFSLRHIIAHWSLRRSRLVSWCTGSKTIFFMSYFSHLDKQSCSSGEFYSHQWEALPEVLKRNGVKSNWMHHFLTSQVVPDTKTAIDWVEYFNSDKNKLRVHTFLDSYLSIGVIYRAIVTWLRIVLRSSRIRNIKSAFIPKNSDSCFWYLLMNDWYKSTFGVVGLQNAIFTELYYEALSNMPKQKLGLYLYEGQGWERAFIHAWKKHGHGELIGVVHSAVRFWDLRHFHDMSTINSQKYLAMPQPDRIAINGPAAWNAYLDSDFQKEKLVAVEALRYLRLNNTKYQNSSKSRKTFPVNRLLVLGAIAPDVNKQAMKLLTEISEITLNNIEIVIKPHPACLIQKIDYPSLCFELTTSPLSEILDEFDVVYGANITTANLDAYSVGLSVIVHLSEDKLNLSPLRGMEDVKFVSSSKELESVLEARESEDINKREPYFWLDEGLPKWSALLEEYGN